LIATRTVHSNQLGEHPASALVRKTLKALLARIDKEIMKVSIPRQSRGLYNVSRSKRLRGDANAAPTVWATVGWPTQSPSFN
jgi:hypothetical protein